MVTSWRAFLAKLNGIVVAVVVDGAVRVVLVEEGGAALELPFDEQLARSRETHKPESVPRALDRLASDFSALTARI